MLPLLFAVIAAKLPNDSFSPELNTRPRVYILIIDQARGQDGWILAEFSFCVFMDPDEVAVHKNAKRE